jgi:hypothetical protein
MTEEQPRRMSFERDKTGRTHTRYTNRKHGPIEGTLYFKHAVADALGERIVVTVERDDAR